LVAAYINGLGGIVDQQVRFRMPSSLEAVQVAITGSNVEQTRETDTKKCSAQSGTGYQAIVCFNCGNRGTVGLGGRMIPSRVMVAPKNGGWSVAWSNRPCVEEFLHARDAQRKTHPVLSL
jgi:hypothetical protein